MGYDKLSWSNILYLSEYISFIGIKLGMQEGPM